MQRSLEAPSRLLDPVRGVVDFTGRDDELADLVAWCEDDAAPRLRLVTGPGGTGKTRLALRLCGWLRELGWRCERVGDQQESGVVSRIRATTSGRVLLVVDYAETRIGLAGLLRAVAADEGAALRVLLVARSAGQWWEQLSAGEAAVRDLVGAAGSGGHPLGQVIDAASTDEELVLGAVPFFAHALRVEPPKWMQVTLRAGRARVLELHAAALVLVLDFVCEPGSDARVDLAEVLDELLKHEERFWLGSARALGLLDGPAGLTVAMLREIVAAGSLLGAADESEALDVLARVAETCRTAKVAAWLHDLYPPDRDSGEWLGMLQPDRLAEQHIVTQLGRSATLAQRCLTGLNERQARRTVILLARASTEHDVAERLLGRLLPLVSEVVANIEAPRETLVSIANAIPYPSVLLASAHAALARRIVDTMPLEASPAERATWLNILGTTLAQLGRLAEALAVIQEGVALRRDLATADPDRYRPDLAGSLINLGNCFSELGRPDEALAVIQEGVALRRDLATADPDRYRPDLAGSLPNLAPIYSELGLLADALLVTQEAVTIHRDLAASNPDRYRSDLATSLVNLGAALQELGRPVDALPATEEAVTIRRDLANADPDRCRPDLADSLANLGVVLVDLDRPVDALPVTEESVTIRRELATANPDRYRPDLATSLVNLGAALTWLGHPDDALPVIAEAVTIRRELVTVNPHRYRPDLATSLYNLAISLAWQRRPADALPVIQEAIAIRRELAAASPDRYGPDLAAPLHSLGTAFLRLNRSADALPAMQESVTIRRSLVTANPDRYRPDLADSLANLGITFLRLNRPADALPAMQESATIRRDLANADSDRHRSRLAESLVNLMQVFLQLGQTAEAEKVRKEAMRLKGDT